MKGSVLRTHFYLHSRVPLFLHLHRVSLAYFLDGKLENHNVRDLGGGVLPGNKRRESSISYWHVIIFCCYTMSWRERERGLPGKPECVFPPSLLRRVHNNLVQPDDNLRKSRPYNWLRVPALHNQPIQITLNSETVFHLRMKWALEQKSDGKSLCGWTARWNE